MLKVLLVAPTDPKVSMALKLLVGGENTYTNTLLQNPPKGVKYIYHLDALKNGQIEYTFLHKLLAIFVKFRILPLSAGSQIFRLKEKFDLVHCHAYSIKVYGSFVPIILSDSSSNYVFLKDYINWSTFRIKLGYFLRRNLFRVLGICDCDTNWEKAKKIVVFSKFAHKIHRQLGVSKEKLEIVYAGLPRQSLRHSGDRAKRGRPESLLKMDSGQARMTDQEVNILFVGTWFVRKGGHLLLEAFDVLSKKYPNLKLTIAGEVPNKLKVKSEKLKVYDYVPREKLLREFFPKADVFVLVPPKIEGFGFAVVEAMSFGLPVIVSNVSALPELIIDGKSGFVVKAGSVDDLTKKLEILIKNPNLRKKMGEAAGKRFKENFSVERANEQLLKIYKQYNVRSSM